MYLNLPARFLLELGFFPQHSGFGYLAYAIKRINSDPLSHYSGKVNVFKELSKTYGVSESCAKRCMNYSIQMAWNLPYNKALHDIFPAYTKEFPPSLGEFMCRLAIEIDTRTLANSNSEHIG